MLGSSIEGGDRDYHSCGLMTAMILTDITRAMMLAIALPDVFKVHGHSVCPRSNDVEAADDAEQIRTCRTHRVQKWKRS